MAEADYRYLLVIEFEGHTVTYGPVFSHIEVSAKREDHKSKGKNEDP